MKKTAIIISLLSLVSAYTFNSINLTWLKKDSVELRYNETVKTVDDLSYIQPAQNYLISGELKNKMPGNGSYFLRPPGYSSLFIAFGYFFEMDTTVKAVKLLQLGLFAMSVYCLFFIAYIYLNSKKMAVFVTSIYGITSIASGFLFYTLTEGITPALVIFYVYLLLIAKNQERQEKNTRIIMLLLRSSLFFL